ncbi:MAG TPA: hypothetical protein VFK79_12000 [Xanthobacteraceae bacterium]|nr:hypothetical protein [Xanthobacteraceae bacterium]
MFARVAATLAGLLLILHQADSLLWIIWDSQQGGAAEKRPNDGDCAAG